ncbi:FecR protein [Posidoniimonas corsicana]|uniref:FecR protein n=2 Tax=Posidoniimonas corsicana TaxID=1938618 RepID=A0A5C5V9H3_9BACT|nr:FecR protein [Posidoniimonas corsicana]
MSDQELKRLIDLWVSGRINDQESELLQRELIASAASRELFRRYSQLDAAMHEIADAGVMRRLSSLVRGDQQHRRPDRDASSQRTNGGRRSHTFSAVAAWCVTIAAALVLTVSTFALIGSDRPRGPIAESDAPVEPGADSVVAAVIQRPPAPVATLSYAEGVQWEQTPVQIGQAILEGESVRMTRGVARVSVGFGAEIVAAAPCSMTFVSASRVRLHSGKVAVDVAPWAKGFTVVTEDMDVVDLGTTFTVSANPGMTTEATVLKGMVRVNTPGAGGGRRRGVLLTEGQQVSSDPTRGGLDTIRPDDIVRILGGLDFGAKGAYRPVALNNTGVGLAEGDEDLHWRIIAGPEGAFEGPQYATVCVPHRQYMANDPASSQWVSIVDWQSAAPHSVYTFATEFDLQNYDLSTMQLFGRFLADNGVAEVRVNGKEVPVQSWVDNVGGQLFRDPQFRFVNVTDGLVRGRNVIEIDVRNGFMRGKTADISRNVPNPMALRVEWYAFGRQERIAGMPHYAPQRLMK